MTMREYKKPTLKELAFFNTGGPECSKQENMYRLIIFII
jgi:hypothetical protein